MSHWNRQQVKKVDVIGDVHGCYDELLALVEKLGYVKGEDGLYRHPEGRYLAFVGDLTDRGPKNRSALFFALHHHEAGLATYVQGNHCNKLGRWLKGNNVRVGHGLQGTIDELSDLSDSAKKRLSDRVLGLPLYATFDGGNLLVCHAAPPPEGASSGKIRSVCLYGHTTGRKDANGYPERLNWVPEYNRNADDQTPYVVYGHVTHQDPYVTENACCIDTACFAGNRLSAFRWPEKEIVSVPSQQRWEGERVLILHDQKPCPTPTKSVMPSEISTLDLDVLLGKLKSNEVDILYLIDTDPLLKKREHDNGLVIANASPSLFEPKKEHQLYAKGIVYRRNPYRLVSLPLVKMFNHGMREFSDRTTQDLLGDPDPIKISFPEKVDGTMIQVFADRDTGDVYFTTRSVLEGTESENDPDSFNYLESARKIAEEKYPNLLKPSLYGSQYSFVFELIHPDTRIVTDYGDREDLVLLSMFDLETFQYLSTDKTRRLGSFMGLTTTMGYDNTAQSALEGSQAVDSGDTLQIALEAILRHLEAQEHKPEGVIVCLEKEDRVVHRVKVKTAPYLKYHRLKFHCTYKSVVNMVWNEPELHTWEAFLDYIRANGLSEEEVESFYREHFEEFKVWLNKIHDAHRDVIEYVDRFERENADLKKDLKAYYKKLAISSKGHDYFGLIMQRARSGALDTHAVMRAIPAYDGFKGEVDKWRKEGDT